MQKLSFMRENPLQFRLGIFLVACLVAVLIYFVVPSEPEYGIPVPEEMSDSIPDFAEFTDIPTKKQAFFDYLRPAVKYHNQIILAERALLQAIAQKMESGQKLSQVQQDKLAKISGKYRLEETPSDVNSISNLLRQVDIVPLELVLAQAANESAWGTSRFARKGYNFFGMWCFRKGCGFVPKSRDDDAVHEVAKFRDLSHAVRAYLRNINTHYAYSDLRDIRARLRSNQKEIAAEPLAQGLMSYSERGQDYIDELLEMIRFNRKYIDA
ncbi:glucosaminidase domain-containing protein [Lacimicrobium alkaliphilum]|uniref:Glycoside hydrolase family 73 n=1 Tax=Lacimicrobium alkaliphilum TaxID=1526571 RepID=A0ABQ1R2E2_9ALTE|nr:glucosaminidase domain-containing protein [Lacimicrobium alkaliphilum]GGD52709.1 glycoside hydrolase family 73 [Lacimicrobium alkaliphilum]